MNLRPGEQPQPQDLTVGTRQLPKLLSLQTTLAEALALEDVEPGEYLRSLLRLIVEAGYADGCVLRSSTPRRPSCLPPYTGVCPGRRRSDSRS